MGVLSIIGGRARDIMGLGIMGRGVYSVMVYVYGIVYGFNMVV